MNARTSLEASYLTLLKFILLSKQRVIELGAEHGLTGMQTMMLFLLDESRPMNSFTKIFNCDASNVTGLVDGLEQKRLAKRYASEHDRRIKMVKLLAEGERMRSALLHQLAEYRTQGKGLLFSKLNDHERQTLITLLQKITNGS